MKNIPISFHPLLHELENCSMARWAQQLPEQICNGLSCQRFGDLPRWFNALEQLPNVKAKNIALNHEVCIGAPDELTATQAAHIETQMRALIPWRKGPFHVFNTLINSEWRSDWKWDRVQQHLADLNGRTILDVGCGNGYHCLRMFGAGARRVIGIDPSPRFVVQFYMIKHFLDEQLPVDVLPVALEDLPDSLQAFDTTFSMGVFYHRRSPMDHLRQLKDTLKSGGELVLETLVIDGKLGDCLVPEDRYAKMSNVWFLPSIDTLVSWLKKSGFKHIRCVDINTTSLEEQRTTDWMTFHSLKDFLDPNDRHKTAEGHPAPMRAVLIAEKP